MKAWILSLPDELCLYFCGLLPLRDLLSLRMTCSHLLRITRDNSLLSKTLDTNQCSEYSLYLMNFLRDPLRRKGVEKLIISHTPHCMGRETSMSPYLKMTLLRLPCTSGPITPFGSVDVSSEGVRVYVDEYGLSEADSTPGEYMQHNINIMRILRDCPNINHLCLPDCRLNDVMMNVGVEKGLVIQDGPTTTELPVRYSQITHLETNPSEPVRMWGVFPFFRNASSLNILLEADVLNFTHIEKLPVELTLLCATDLLENDSWDFFKMWTNCPATRLLRLHRPRWSTTIEELEQIVTVLDAWLVAPHVVLETVEIWDKPNQSRHTERWQSLLASRPFITVHAFDASLYDNSRCAVLRVRPLRESIGTNLLVDGVS
jgi:hypothetical protein